MHYCSKFNMYVHVHIILCIVLLPCCGPCDPNDTKIFAVKENFARPEVTIVISNDPDDSLT